MKANNSLFQYIICGSKCKNTGSSLANDWLGLASMFVHSNPVQTTCSTILPTQPKLLKCQHAFAN